jgi:hypothetical protein
MNESTRIKNVEWYTPPEVFTALGFEFDLDPASPGATVVPWVPARQHFTRADDGLMQPWHGHVWLNPPYGAHTSVWLEKLANHGDGIALVLSRTDTEWFHRAATRADVVCFSRGRFKFFEGSENSQTPPQQSFGSVAAGSVFFAFGEICTQAVLHSGLGIIMRHNAVLEERR